jgi:hypothetical protein
MNSTGAEPDIESELIDLDGVPFTKLSDVNGEALHRSMFRVMERTLRIRKLHRTNAGGNGERID